MKKQTLNIGSGNVAEESLTQAEIDAITAEETAEAAKTATSFEVAEEAQRRIDVIHPQLAQNQLLIRMLQLLDKWRRTSNLSNDEQNEMTDINLIWDWINSVHTAKEQIQATPPHPNDLLTDNRWPADPALSSARILT